VSLLDVRGLVAGYGGMEVLHGIDFHVDEGEIVVILGANGAGKTTTLRCLSGMVSGRGEVVFDGRQLGHRRRADRVARLGIAHVPQGRGTFVDLTVTENLRVGAHLRRDRAAVTDEIDHWFETFPQLRERQDQAAGMLSGGEQQMLAVARAMLSRPRLVLLDEPSLGLAPIITQDLFRRLGAIVADVGTALLLVEQNASLALELAQRAYVMEAGTITVEGPAEQLRRDDSVRRAYLGA
jgi:branched-chain amino acid transport system ATP-binding protein